MYKYFAKLFGCLILFGISSSAYSQVPGRATELDTGRIMESIPLAFSEVPYFTYGQGLGIMAPDSLFAMNIRFRMQNRAGFTFQEDQATQIEARVRRLRLRFDGFVYNPRLSYVLQLSFTRGDMDWENTEFPNIVRDAMIFYRLTNKLVLGFGQTKLPGNRQRVNSSGDLQFVDRSIVNATLNVDRDFGLQAAYTDRLINNFHYVLRGAVSTGEGRNILATDGGLAYTGRVEILPFGMFERFGDYFEGDLIREKTPKLSIGVTSSLNRNTLRTGGQIGTFLYERTDMDTYMTDWFLKYRGFAFASELLYRTSPNALTFNPEGDMRYVYTGLGQNYQASYIFFNNVEVAGRYTQLAPRSQIDELEPLVQHYTVGVTKYLKGHRVKVQTDLTYEDRQFVNPSNNFNNWQLRFQVELGI
ncbi:porin [Litoribacter alkaliphilus]|uniref:Porin n=1 Tax=Litoribacter ruber TaxID=702568 RepID=A0AAP2CGT8_9BACT|nr:porin [Litoribacter alkaliphilus]MBS9524443.1 porin [Litoribacter alkaliphilus]